MAKRKPDADQIAHAFDGHGRELTPGQISITKEDFLRYGETLTEPDWIKPGLTPGTVVWEKRFADGTICALEFFKEGKQLQFRTMYKQALHGVMTPILQAGRHAAGAEEDEEE